MPDAGYQRDVSVTRVRGKFDGFTDTEHGHGHEL